MTSIECLPPSYQFAPIVRRRDDRIVCGCCHFPRERGHIVHDELGALCVYCSLAFDQRLDSRPRQRWLPLRDVDSCAACIEQSGCLVHDD